MGTNAGSRTVNGLTRAELEDVLVAARAAVLPTSRFRLFGITAADVDLAHAETRDLLLSRYAAPS